MIGKTPRQKSCLKTQPDAIKPANCGKFDTKAPKKQNKKTPKIKVLFVCTGNTCRSPMAEHIFKKYIKTNKISQRFDIKSAGLYAEAQSKTSQGTVFALGSIGIKITPKPAIQLTEAMAEAADIIICMTAAHKLAIEGHPATFAVGELLGANDVPDPFGMQHERYLAVANYLEYACPDFLSAALATKKTTT